MMNIHSLKIFRILIIFACFFYKATSFRISTKALKYLSTKTSTCLDALKGPVRYSGNDYWIQNLKRLPSSRVLKLTKPTIILFTIWTAILTILSKVGYLTFTLPSTIHSILGSALSLLLVFRTNSSYDRFWEGRKKWSDIIFASRELGRLANVCVKDHRKERLAKLIVAFSMCLKQHLQGERLNEEVEGYFQSEEETLLIQKLRNRPNYIILMIQNFLHAAIAEYYPDDSIKQTTYETLTDECLHILNNAATSCERIVKQPVPSDYSRHSSRFKSIYLATLPLALLPSVGWATIPIMTVVSWTFFGIGEIGRFMEEPFQKEYQIISLFQLVRVVRIDLAETLYPDIICDKFENVDKVMLEAAKQRTQGDDNWFAYY